MTIFNKVKNNCSLSDIKYVQEIIITLDVNNFFNETWLFLNSVFGVIYLFTFIDFFQQLFRQSIIHYKESYLVNSLFYR